MTPAKPIRPLQWFIAFAAMAGASSALEGIWYLDLAEPLYQREIGKLLNVEFDGFVAILFYLVYALGALVFALRPALQAGRWQLAAGLGALYGLFCFSAHNLTDLADVHGYTPLITAVDIAWGTCMSAVAASLAYLASRRLG